MADPVRRRFVRRVLVGGALLPAILASDFLFNPDPYSAPAPRKEFAIERKTEPAPAGLTETAGVSLTLLDVEVVDKQGKSIRGLTKDDFVVMLNGLEYPIYSLDDLCPCGGEKVQPLPGSRAPIPADLQRGQPAEAATKGKGSAVSAGSTTPGGKSAASAAPSESHAVRYILYFDFAHMGNAGRSIAVGEATRWVKETKRPDDEVMIAGFSWGSDFREFTPFTRDTGTLVSMIEKAAKDPSAQDPFPERLDGVGGRIQECLGSIKACMAQAACELPTGTCTAYAQEEYRHSQASLRSLKTFLTRLGGIPGRKALIYFNQNGSLTPAGFYPPRGVGGGETQTEQYVGDVQRELPGLGAEAALSRTTVYAASVGDTAVTLGSNLADLTGGKYNRGLGDLAAITNAARTSCTCLYRVGLEPPRSGAAGKIYNASVEVRGNRVPRSYRVQFLDDVDRWVRSAAGVLRNPGRSTDLEIAAAVVPVRRINDRWEISIEVAVDIDALAVIHSAAGTEGAWEAGALLSTAGGEKKWELLGIFGLRRSGEGKTGKAVVHRSTLSDLAPGKYRLAAFVRDKTATIFGGAEALLELPERHTDGVSGPVVMRSGKPFLPAPLPAFKKSATSSTVSRSVENGPIPASHRPFPAGEPLEIRSWICPAGKNPAPPALTRFIARGGVPVYKFEVPVLEVTGECYQLSDTIPTASLAPGDYSYHLKWQRAGKNPPLTAETSFEVGPPG